MVTARDVEKILSLLRRVYERRSSSTCRAALNDINLAFLDACDTILEIVTYDSTTIHNTMAMADTFRIDRLPAVEGPLPRQPRRLAGRHRRRGPRAGARPGAGAPRRARTAGSSSRRTTRACRSSSPTRGAQISQDVVRVAREMLDAGRVAGRGRAVLRRRCPTRGRSGSSTPGVGGLTVLREILRRSPAESTIYLGDNARAPYGVRSDDEVLAFSIEALDAARRARRQGASSSPATPRPRSRCGDLRRALRPADPRRHPARARRRRRSRPATGGSASSRRRRRSARTPTSPRSRTRTRRSRSTSTRPRRSCRWSRRASCRGPERRGGGRARRSRRSSASATRPASSSSRGRRGARSTRCCSAAPTTRCSRPSSRAVAGDRVAIVDSATATASALAELLAINGLEAPGTTGGTAADAGHDGHDRPATGAGRPSIASSRPATSSAFRAIAGADVRRRRSRTSSRSSSAVAALMTDRDAAATTAAAGIPRRAAVAGRVPRRLGARRGGDGRRAAAERTARDAGLVDWPAGRADRDRPAARGARDA